MKGKIQLIYLDPPFFSHANYFDSDNKKNAAYTDKWGNNIEHYLIMLEQRLTLIRELLNDEGSIFVHLDGHAVHYVKVLMDKIFGADNFINEIIWQYKSGGASKRHFGRKHDNILFYAKTKSYYFKQQKEKSYNRGLKPYSFKGVKEYKDEIGWYTLVNMKDVWQIDMVGRTSKERNGYATQKPELLMQRIVSACSRENDICADFFCGSGSFVAVCEKLKRKWIATDIGEIAIEKLKSRIEEIGGKYEFWKENGTEKNEIV